MNSNPLVSVVIPTYNHAHFLGRAIQSVLDQTYDNWEMIIVDNHSQDKTDEVVGSFSNSKIKLLKIHNNGVIAASRNMGILAAKGDWIAFLDSDDLWYPKKLEIALKDKSNNSNVDVISTDEMLVDSITGSKRLLKYGPYRLDFYERLLVSGNCMSTSATIVRRNFLSKANILFRENKEFVTAEDYDLWLLLARAGAIFMFIPSVQGEYSIHSTNNSGQIERHLQNIKNVVLNHVYELQTFEKNKDKLREKIESRFLIEKAKDQIKKLNFYQGILDLLLAFKHSFNGSLFYIFSEITKKQ